MNTSSKLQVEITDLDRITKNTLGYYFNSSLCTNAIQCKSSNDAELLIVDADRSIADGFLKGLRKNNQYAIVLHKPADEFVDEERLIGLTKPIQQNQLKKIIDTVYELVKNNRANSSTEATHTQSPSSSQLKSNLTASNHPASLDKKNQNSDSKSSLRFKLRAYVGSNSDIKLSSTASIDHIYITPKKYLYHHLAKAVKIGKLNKSDVIIKTLSGRVLYENSSQQFYCSDWSRLKHIQANPLFEDTTLAQTKAGSELSKEAPLSATETTWEAALLASKGRLPMGTSLYNVVEIISWPDFSKLIMFEYTDNIITAWSHKQMSVINTAYELKIPQRYVFALYCAMEAINSAKIEKQEGSIKKLREPNNRDIFSRLFSNIVNT